jgi:hypothetical protein
MMCNEKRPGIIRLREAIGCPICWEDFFVVPSLCKDLRIYWVKLAERHQVDDEVRFYSRLECEMSLYSEKLEAIRRNAQVWRKDATAEYEDRVGFLRTLHFALPSEYGKHLPNPQWNREQIIEKTRHGDALFFSNISLGFLSTLMWYSIENRLVMVLEKRPRHIYLAAQEEIGAAKGEATRFMRFDFDYATSIAHGHPRTEYEIPTGEEIVSDDESQQFSRDDYMCFNHVIDEPDDETITPHGTEGRF